MKRTFLMLALLVAAALTPAATAKAAIVFDKDVILNFKAISGLSSATNISDVNGFEFGSSSLSSPTGRSALNTTDVDSSGGLSVGDTTRVVGHALIDSVSRSGALGAVGPLDGGGSPSFQMTGVLRNLDGTWKTVVTPFSSSLDNVFSGGFLDVYIDTGADDFDVEDLGTSADGALVATFELLEGFTKLTTLTTSSTNLQFKLVSQAGDDTASLDDDFFQLAGGLDPLAATTSLLATQVITADNVVNPATFDNIAGTAGAVDAVVDIGSGFLPGPGGGLDVIANFDGNSAFAVIPEPSSLLILGGLFGMGAFAKRRKKRAAKNS